MRPTECGFCGLCSNLKPRFLAKIGQQFAQPRFRIFRLALGGSKPAFCMRTAGWRWFRPCLGRRAAAESFE
jgi:hypothetical protein